MIAAKNPVIEEAYCKLQVMSEDEANRMVYEARLKAWRDEYSRLQGARNEGREEGREEGRQALAEKDQEIEAISRENEALRRKLREAGIGD
jgi:predicted transposase YdaD